ncbi:hypothetical protein [Mesorhizobium sp. L2C067A000]|uniref:hypothetical protein n=1 Tax=Mesorhizobium sp. L2C067A000 TaxID=1287106 RepID=UPI0003D05C42|nr:hypothetical protein [Mesorhizobium sp. L2C067A000]ESZ26602.1 hypothetical protein X733_29485 [Mesorhizobium sp. L2C067A000]
MARRGRRRKKGSGGTILAAAALAVLSVVMLAGFVWMWSRSGKDQIDASTNCPMNGPVSLTAVLIDATDPISPITMADLKNEFRKSIGRIEPGGYLRILTLGATPGDLTVMFDGCNPGDGSTVDSWTNNPSRRQKKWEDAFEDPLKKLPDQIPNGESASQSPIIAGIQKIKLSLYDSGLAKEGTAKRIIVVSDMIEHTALYSQYRSGLDYKKYLDSAADRTYGTSLDGVGVTILYVDRAKKPFGSLEHAEFWTRWVQSHHGEFEKLVGLEGLN